METESLEGLTEALSIKADFSDLEAQPSEPQHLLPWL